MIDLSALNSATKYPSIPTYHALGERGILTEEAAAFHGDVILTEKVDGSNGRIVRLPGGDWFIGSREELLTARGDRVHNPSQGIVDALRPLADRLVGEDNGQVMVYFLEAYGGRIGGQARQYTGAGTVGCRMFDLAWVDPAVLAWDRERIASWRDGGGQTFSTEHTLRRCAAAEGIELTPRLGTVPAEQLPTTLEGTLDWLTGTLPGTLVALDERAGGRAEGIVLRTTDRSVIAKARFQDYERTIKARRPQQGKRAAVSA